MITRCRGISTTGRSSDCTQRRSTGQRSTGHQSPWGKIGWSIDAFADFKLALQPCSFIQVLQRKVVTAVKPSNVKHAGR